MSLPQQKFREIVFQLLYSYDISQPDENGMIDLIMHELCVTKKSVRAAIEKVEEILIKRDEIDKAITKASTSYDFGRIQSVERNILRIGVFELFYDDLIPPLVAISEAVRLSRKFGTPESSRFVNAVLDVIYKTSQGVSAESETIAEKALEWEKSNEIPADVLDQIQKAQTKEENEPPEVDL